MSTIEIIRVGGGGGNGVVMEMNELNESVMNECIIRYEWKNNSSSVREQYLRNEEEGGGMCVWNKSVIVLTNNLQFKMNGCELNGSRSGGISVNGGELNMIDCVFEGTYSEKEGFESVKRNVICSDGGSIVMNGYNGESIKKNTSLWIVIGDCSFETSEEEPESVLYVPILTTVRYDGEGRLSFYGEMMIGCNMSYEVFYSSGAYFTRYAVSLSGGESENESVICTSLANALSSENGYTAQLLYEEEGSGESGGGGGGGGREVKSGGGANSRGRVIGVVILVVGVVVGGGVCGGVCMMRRKEEGEKRRGENNTEMHLTTALIDEREENDGEWKSEGEGGEKGEEGKEGSEGGEEREGGSKGSERSERSEGSRRNERSSGSGELEGEREEEEEYSVMSGGMDGRTKETTVSGGKGRVSSDIQVLVAD